MENFKQTIYTFFYDILHVAFQIHRICQFDANFFGIMRKNQQNEIKNLLFQFSSEKQVNFNEAFRNLKSVAVNRF